jgi:hypothetical protein
MTTTLDETLDAIASGDTATVLRAELASRIHEREAATVNRLVADYRAGSLKESSLRDAVAAISEGRALLEDLTRTMRLGNEARQRAAQPGLGISRAGGR